MRNLVVSVSSVGSMPGSTVGGPGRPDYSGGDWPGYSSGHCASSGRSSGTVSYSCSACWGFRPWTALDYTESSVYGLEACG